MNRRNGYMVCLVALALLAVACSRESGNGAEPRPEATPSEGQPAEGNDPAQPATAPGVGQTAGDAAILGYDRLDLDTPESAVEIFSTAFSSGDFVTATLLLDHGAQSELLRAIWNLTTEAFLTPTAQEAFSREFLNALPESDSEAATFFASAALLWRTGMTEGGLPVDLSAGITAVTVESMSETSSVATAVLPASDQRIEISLTRSREGNWRISQLRPEDETTQEGLFAGITPGGSTPVDPANLTSFRDRHDLSTPEAAAMSWLGAQQGRNWVAVFVLADPSTQMRWSRAASSLNFDLFIGAPWGAELSASWAGLGDAEHVQVDPLVREFWSTMDTNGSLPLAVDTFSLTDTATTDGPTLRGNPSRIVTVAVDGAPFEVTVVEDAEGDWRPVRLAPAETAVDDDATGLVIPGPQAPIGPTSPGTICSDAIVRYDCDAPPPELSVRAELDAALDEILARVDAGELTEAEAVIEIQVAQQELANSFGDPDEVCAAMQRGDGRPLGFAASLAEIEMVASDYCPGDPALVVIEGAG